MQTEFKILLPKTKPQETLDQSLARENLDVLSRNHTPTQSTYKLHHTALDAVICLVVDLVTARCSVESGSVLANSQVKSLLRGR